MRLAIVVDKVSSALLRRRQVAREARYVSELQVALADHSLLLKHKLCLLSAFLLLRAHLRLVAWQAH